MPHRPGLAFPLRKARPSDAAAVARIHITAMTRAMPWLHQSHTDDEAALYFGALVDSGRVVVSVGDRDEAVGFAAIGDAWLDQLYVDPARQGTGIGSELLAEAKRQMPDGFGLWAFQRNLAARGFYERRGLVSVEFTDGSGNEEKEPDVRYEWHPEP